MPQSRAKAAAVIRGFYWAFVIGAVSVGSTTVYAAPGDLDMTFGSAGAVVTNLSDEASWYATAIAIALQTDGRIVAGGYSIDQQSGTDFAVVRYESSGTVDSTFGELGKVLTRFGNCYSTILALAIQPDGKIVAAGSSNCGSYSLRLALARYNPDGTLDSSFADDGLFLGDDGEATSIAIQGDGKILVTSAQYSDSRVVRLLSNGSPDPAFGSAGVLGIGSFGRALALAIQPDGDIVVAGDNYNSYGVQSQCFIARIHSDGSLDTTFDSDGLVLTLAGRCNTVARQSDGKIVVAGAILNSFDDVRVARLDAAGAFDTTFDDDGIAVTSVDAFDDQATAALIQGDGRILVVASSPYNAEFGFVVLRYDTNGELDTTFDADGIATTVPGAGGSFGAAIQLDGRIVVSGNVVDAAERDFAVARFNGVDGSIDTTFAGDGMVTTRTGRSIDMASFVATGADGTIVATGSKRRSVPDLWDTYSSVLDLAVTRYTSDGTLDASWGASGIVSTPISDAASHYYQGIAGLGALQPDGKVVVVGAPTDPDVYSVSTEFVIARYDIDGSLDTTFGDAGMLRTTLSESEAQPHAVVLQEDGSILVAGYAGVDGFRHIVLVRYSAAGELDTSFDGDGIVYTAIGDARAEANGVAIQSDGRIVVAGSADYYGISGFAAARYLPDGSLDATFSDDGIASRSVFFGSSAAAGSVAVQPDGKIILAGAAWYGSAVVRLNPNGLADPTFDSDGKLTFGSQGADALALQSDGKILVAAYDPYEYSTTVTRILDDGTLDSTFGVEGIAHTSIATLSNSYPASMSIDGVGRILVAGTAASDSGIDFMVLRFEGDACGNSSTDAGEECDDGNLVSEDGCSAGCRLEPCGDAPNPSCLEPLESGHARIQMKDHPEDTRDNLKWTWGAGPFLDPAEFGNPATTDDYWLCIYDGGNRVSSTRIPRGRTCGNKDCWSSTPEGFVYASSSDLPEGATQLVLTAGGDGKSAARFRGRSVSLEMPAVATLVGPLVVQLQRGDAGVCLSSTFSPPFRKHDAVKLAALSD